MSDVVFTNEANTTERASHARYLRSDPLALDPLGPIGIDPIEAFSSPAGPLGLDPLSPVIPRAKGVT